MQKPLEGERYVKGSFVDPPIYDPRKGLNKASVDLREPTSVDSRDKATVRSMVVPFVEVLIEDLNNRLGGGGVARTY